VWLLALLVLFWLYGGTCVVLMACVYYYIKNKNKNKNGIEKNIFLYLFAPPAAGLC